MSGRRLHVKAFQTFDDEVGYGVDWERDVDLPSPGGGTREAALLVEVGVDGQYTTVQADLYVGADDRAVLKQAIHDLGVVLAHLESIDGHRGSCIKHGDWGRCMLTADHSESCRFPTEAEFRRRGF